MKPFGSLLVPIRDFGTETIRLVRVIEFLVVNFSFFFFVVVDQYGVDVKGVVIGGGGGGGGKRRRF